MNKNKLKNFKIVLLQGENGRKLIENYFIKKKINFCIIECYKRVLKNLDINLEIKKWRSYKINALIITNGQTLTELKNMTSHIDQIEWLFKCKIFVVGMRLKKIANGLGYKHVIVSKYANNNKFLNLIINNNY